MKCARTVCNNETSIRIYNDPGTEKGYRLYCRNCASKILGFNQTLEESQRLRYEEDFPSTTAGTEKNKAV